MVYHILNFGNVKPKIHKTVFIAEGVYIIGDVEIGEESSVWFNSVIRGDVYYIRIGKFTNIQDGCVIHVTTDRYATVIGDNVTIGHNAIIHGAKISSNVLIGMGAIVMDDVEIGEYTIIGAGAVVTPSTKIKPYSLYVGAPAKFKREITPAEIEQIKESAIEYNKLAKKYAV